MTSNKELQKQFPHCEIVEVPKLYTHIAEEDMDLYCTGIQQGREADGRLLAGAKVAIHNENSDFPAPWIITEDGIVAQVQGKLKSISF